MLIQAVALAQSHLSAYLVGVSLYLIDFEKSSGIEEQNIVLVGVLLLSGFAIIQSFVG